MPLVVLSMIFTLSFLFPESKFKAFTTIGYYDPETGLYSKGIYDLFYCITWVLAFTLIRASAMQYVYIPFARKLCGITRERSLERFSEQAWSFTYYSISWLLGIYIVYHSPYWMNTKQLWAEDPDIQLDHFFKWYYLVQFGFWIQQVFVLNCEARRKDFEQMFLHHIITCVLLLMSYCYNQTRVGNAILCLMDFADILLSLAKMLRYSGWQRICDATFVLFLISWIISRHYIYIIIIISAWHDAPRYLGGYRWDPSKGILFTKPIHYIFMALLIALQIVLCVWLSMILRVLYKVVTGSSAEDTRSDDESEDSDENEDQDLDSIGNEMLDSTQGKEDITENRHIKKKRTDIVI